MATTLRILSNSLEATFSLGSAIHAAAEAPLLVLLAGQLGGGKTHLTKGIMSAACGAALRDITSPTFTLLQRYGSAPCFGYHIDLYRIESAEDTPEEIIDALEDRRAWVCVEWADRHPELMPRRTTLSIKALHRDEDSRIFELSGAAELLAHIGAQIEGTEGLALLGADSE